MKRSIIASSLLFILLAATGAWARDLNTERARAWECFSRGAQYAAQGDESRAIDAYSEAIVWNDKMSEAYLGRAAQYVKKGTQDLAIKDYSHAIALDRLNANAFNNRGLAYLATGRLDLAIQDFTKAVELDSSKAIYRQNRACGYARLKQYDKAIADYTFVIGAEPKNGDAYAGRGAAHYGRSAAQAAKVDFEKACTLGSQTGCENLKTAKTKNEEGMRTMKQPGQNMAWLMKQ